MSKIKENLVGLKVGSLTVVDSGRSTKKGSTGGAYVRVDREDSIPDSIS